MRLFLAVLLVSVAYPGLAATYVALHGAGARGVLAWSSEHLLLVWAGAAIVVLVALLALERPREASPQAYWIQLLDRFRSVQRELERAVETSTLDRKASYAGTAGSDSRAATERLDGPEAAEITRRQRHAEDRPSSPSHG